MFEYGDINDARLYGRRPLDTAYGAVVFEIDALIQAQTAWNALMEYETIKLLEESKFRTVNLKRATLW